jgi:hypothetical protein
MHDVIIFCKTFTPDLERFKRLHAGIMAHNKDNIPFYICTSRDETATFKNAVGTDGVEYITDQEITGRNFIQTWALQQLVKLQFHRLNVCKNYFWIDSDFVILKDFYRCDFLFREDTPFTVVYDAEPMLDFELIRKPSIMSQDIRREHYAEIVGYFGKIQAFFNRNGPPLHFGAPALWSNRVVAALEAHLQERDLPFDAMLHYAPFEMQWYGEFLLTNQIIPVIPRRYSFNISKEEEYEKMVSLGIGKEALARHYLAVNFNARHIERSDFD